MYLSQASLKEGKIQAKRKIKVQTHLYSKLLQSTDIYGTFLCGIQVASAHTEVASRTHHPTGQSQRVVRQDQFCRTVIILRKQNQRKHEIMCFQQNLILLTMALALPHCYLFYFILHF